MIVTWDRQYYGKMAFNCADVDNATEEAGCTRYWLDLKVGGSVFEVERMPADNLPIGLKWIGVNPNLAKEGKECKSSPLFSTIDLHVRLNYST